MNLTLLTCIKLRSLQWAGHVQRMEGTRIPKKVFKAKFEGVRSVGKLKMRCDRMLQAFCAVATGSWPLMMEHCRGRRRRRPRPDLGCSAIGWMDGYLNCGLMPRRLRQ
jgi:hypothetical protein